MTIYKKIYQKNYDLVAQYVGFTLKKALRLEKHLEMPEMLQPANKVCCEILYSRDRYFHARLRGKGTKTRILPVPRVMFILFRVLTTSSYGSK
jgi:hypothetical protein